MKQQKRILSALLSAVLFCGALFCVPGFVVQAEGEKLIAFTFDDGPGRYTSDLIDELDRRGVKSTFFMLGKNIASYPEVVEKMLASGHELGNHSYSHPYLPNLNYDEIQKEIMDTNALLQKADGETYHIMRCPYGESNADVASIVNAPLIYWSIDTLDWDNRDADFVYNSAIETAYDGAIVLAHDIYETSVTGMLRAIDTLQAQGYEFVTVSELLRRRGVNTEKGKLYFDARNKGTTLPAETPKVDPIGTAYVKNSCILRKSTEKDSEITSVLPAGSLLLLLNTDDKKNSMVRSPWGEDGYLPASQLTVLAKGEQPPTEETHQAKAVSPPANPLSLGMQTTTCTDIYDTEKGGVALGRLPAHSPVTVLEKTSDKVSMIRTVSGTVAYVATQFLEEIPTGAGRTKHPKDDKSIEVSAPASGAAAIDLNLRMSPSTASIIHSVVTKGTNLTVTKAGERNWCKVTTDDGREGYVQTYFVGTEYTAAKTTADVNFRPAPNTNKEPLALLNCDTAVRILRTEKEWYLVLTSDGRAGYLSADLVAKDETKTPKA